MKGQVHYAVSSAATDEALCGDLSRELADLVARKPAERETTLLICANHLSDFFAFNDFLGKADRLLRRHALEGTVQLASFHPDYRFADAAPDDVTNCTNRSPYPTLHLLREDSIERAVDALENPAAIYESNMDTLRSLGASGWDALGVGRSA